MLKHSTYDQGQINKKYPNATMIKPMRIWSLPKHKKHELQEHCESGEYFAQIKKDGFFYSFNKTKSGSYLFSRNESAEDGLLCEKLTNVPHIALALENLPDDTVVIGEIYIPNKTSKDTTRIMGCLPEKAVQRQQEEGFIHFYIYDILVLKGVSLINLGAEQRYQILLALNNKTPFDQANYIEIAESFDTNIYERLSNALMNGEEGLVLKKKDGVYVPGKKPAWSAIKCKKEDFADVVCIGFEDATKEYSGTELENWEYWENVETGAKVQGNCFGKDGYKPITKGYFKDWKTSIVIGGYENDKLVTIGSVSSGLTDSLREEISTNPDQYIGSVLMVECMEKDLQARTLRHPIFKGFRVDKNPQECILSEIFEI